MLERWTRWCSICAGWIGLLLAWPLAAQATVQVLEQAQARMYLEGAPVQAAAVALPYGWDQHHPNQFGTASFTLQFAGPAPGQADWSLYFKRLGNAYAIVLNGSVLKTAGSLSEFDTTDFAKAPQLVPIPSAALGRNNTLTVWIRADKNRHSGVPAVWVGPTPEVNAEYAREYTYRISASAVAVVFSLIVGTMALVLWFNQTDPRPESYGRHDPVYLMTGIAEWAWALFVSDTLIESPPVPWVCWAIVMNCALGLWLGAILLYCHAIAGWMARGFSRINRWILLLLLLTEPFAAYASIVHGLRDLLSLWQISFALLFAPTVFLFIRQALRASDFAQRLVALALVVNLAIALHDWYVMRVSDMYGVNVKLRYSALLFGVCMWIIAMGRFKRANEDLRLALASMAERVAAKEQELKAAFGRMEAAIRDQARVLERTRILRDMHDGVGAHISSAMRQLQAGNVKTDVVFATLRDSLDYLKLSIDAMQMPPGNVAQLLANVRFRLEPRFAAMGMQLQWAVEPLPRIESLNLDGTRQLQFILFEVISNVLQHAQADTMSIAARVVTPAAGSASPYVQILITDNGVGFDVQESAHKGLKTMHSRAQAIGCLLDVTSHTGGTSVELRFKLAPPAAAQAAA